MESVRIYLRQGEQRTLIQLIDLLLKMIQQKTWTVCPDGRQKRSPIDIPQKLPKNIHISFYIKSDVFQNSPLNHQVFGILL